MKIDFVITCASDTEIFAFLARGRASFINVIPEFAVAGLHRPVANRRVPAANREPGTQCSPGVNRRADARTERAGRRRAFLRPNPSANSVGGR